MVKKQTAMEVMSKKFDEVVQIIDDIAENTKELMPLASESLQLTKSIVKTYKKAFLKGLKK